MSNQLSDAEYAAHHYAKARQYDERGMHDVARTSRAIAAEAYSRSVAAAMTTTEEGARRMMTSTTATDLLRILTRYDEVVRGNTSDEWDAIAAVAEDRHGEVASEVGETAIELDHQMSDEWADILGRLVPIYRDALRLEVAERPHEVDGSAQTCAHLDGLSFAELESLCVDPGRRFDVPCPICVVDQIRSR